TRYPTDIIDPANRCDTFILSLASMFNDFKDAQYLTNLLDESRPNPIHVTPPDSDWVGMRLRVRRLNYSIMHELLVTVSEAEKEGVFEDQRWQRSLRRCNPTVRSLWGQVREVASGKADGWLLRYFQRVRDDIAYHYYNPKLLA